MLSVAMRPSRFYTVDQLIRGSIFQSESYIMEMIKEGLISPVMQGEEDFSIMLFTEDAMQRINEEQLKNLA